MKTNLESINMNNISKNITRLLAFIISLLLAYVIFTVGMLYMQPQDGKKNNGVAIDTSSPVDATLMNAQSMENATSLDAKTKELFSEYVAVNMAVVKETTTWEDRPEKKLPTSYAIDMELVYQHPELPTGCESVALTIALKYYGFDLEKTTIASDYLIYSDNFVKGYMGNPFNYGGAGIYSPGLTRTANIYLDDQGSDLNARNVSGSTPEELYRYISEDTPVVIWNTIHMIPNQPTGFKIKWGQKTYEWDGSEHCMVLSGYDLERNVVIIHDPIDGIVERDADIFWERYENLGSMAIIIR